MKNDILKQKANIFDKIRNSFPVMFQIIFESLKRVGMSEITSKNV